ncbi:MAG: hypothetical protein FD120_2605 [Gammaproteobacteria bacterium]|nr:MAG: hypothetical protein FD120_2605 [Gammaproteobacteria bacterium]
MPAVLMSFLLVLIVFIIIDPNRPKRGLITVDQGPMPELKQGNHQEAIGNIPRGRGGRDAPDCRLRRRDVDRGVDVLGFSAAVWHAAAYICTRSPVRPIRASRT